MKPLQLLGWIGNGTKKGWSTYFAHGGQFRSRSDTQRTLRGERMSPGRSNARPPSKVGCCMPGRSAAAIVAQEWAAKAQSDLRAAVYLLEPRAEPTTDAVCFHAQQCTENRLENQIRAQHIAAHEFFNWGIFLPLQFGAQLPIMFNSMRPTTPEPGFTG